MEEEEYKRWTTGRHEEPPQYKSKPQGAEYYCYTFIIAILCVLIIVVLCGAGVFYWYIFEYRGSSSMSSYIEVPISMKIDKEYMEAYDDYASPEYVNFATTYTTEVNTVFANTRLNDTYLDSIVFSLSPGSVITNSSSFFTNKPDSNASNTSLPIRARLENLKEEVEQIINDAISDGMLGNELPVDPNSSLFVGTPMVIQELPKGILPQISTTEQSPVVTTKTLVTTPIASQSTTAFPTTIKQNECQSPSEVILEVNVAYDLFSHNYPANYAPNTFCQWIIRAPSGLRIRGHFNQLYLEDGIDILHVGTGVSGAEFNMLAYTGTTQQVPLDIISPGQVLVFTFESNQAVEAQGFSIRFEVVDPPGDDLVTCNNGLEILVADDICDARVECNDGSDETDCYDLLRTGICGTQIPVTRILGGQDSQLGSMPWTGSVRTAAGAHYCGATLLTDQWVVTAAHCAEVADHLYFGGLSLDTPSDYEERFDISVIFAHSDYDLLTENNDIALIRLTRPVKISAAIRPICVASIAEDVEELDIYTSCRAVGWGASNSMGGLNPILKEVEMPLVSMDTCNEVFDSIDEPSATKICAGGRPGTDTCTGDNGGPLVCRGDNGLWHIIGITTRSSKCRSADIDVYTRLSAYHNFILYTVTQTDACIGTPFESFCLDGCVGGVDCKTQCYDDQIRCRIGNCIADTKACDGVADCLDSTDEGASQNCTTQGCGGEILLTPGAGSSTISSPGYPNSYQSFHRCQWSVRTTPGNRIKLEFNTFDTEELYDFLHIGTEVTGSNSMLLSLSGDNIPIDVLSVDNVIVLTFEADYSLEKNGFSLQAVAITEIVVGAFTTCSNGMQIVPDPQQRDIRCNGISECVDNSDEIECACGELEHDIPYGGTIQIQSNNYGNGGYPEGTVPCQWIIRASAPDRRLEVTFLDFKTESGYDFVSIATGLEEGATVVSYSGYNIPPGVVSMTSQLVITFLTDNSGSAEGFDLTVIDIDKQIADEKQKCGNNLELLADDDECDGFLDCSDGTDEPDTCKCGDYTLYSVNDGESRDLTSANYPSNYPHSADCTWAAATPFATTPDNDKTLYLHFNDFELEDKVDVLRIDSLNFTGTKMPLDIVSPDGYLLIEFTTDQSISMRGFSLTLTTIDLSAVSSFNYCDNGREILGENDVCNGVIDCNDGSDESSCGA